MGRLGSELSNLFYAIYDNHDSKRVLEILDLLKDKGLSFFEDQLLEHGEDWEHEVTKMIENTKQVFFFVTNSILEYEDSYAKVEYKLATRGYGKKIYIVLLDKIKSSDVPKSKHFLWIELNNNRYIDVSDTNDKMKIVNAIAKEFE